MTLNLKSGSEEYKHMCSARVVLHKPPKGTTTPLSESDGEARTHLPYAAPDSSSVCYTSSEAEPMQEDEMTLDSAVVKMPMIMIPGSDFSLTPFPRSRAASPKVDTYGDRTPPRIIVKE